MFLPPSAPLPWPVARPPSPSVPARPPRGVAAVTSIATAPVQVMANGSHCRRHHIPGAPLLLRKGARPVAVPAPPSLALPSSSEGAPPVDGPAQAHTPRIGPLRTRCG